MSDELGQLLSVLCQGAESFQQCRIFVQESFPTLGILMMAIFVPRPFVFVQTMHVLKERSVIGLTRGRERRDRPPKLHPILQFRRAYHVDDLEQ